MVRLRRTAKLELTDARAGRNRESAFYISACKERDQANSECDAALDERDAAVAELNKTLEQQLEQLLQHNKTLEQQLQLNKDLEHWQQQTIKQGQQTINALEQQLQLKKTLGQQTIKALKQQLQLKKKLKKTLEQQQQQTIKNLRVEVSAAKEQTRVPMGRTADKQNEDQLKSLRADLEAALQRVDAWQAAEEAVAKECPDLCCPLSLHERLMHDPVYTVDGRTYERLAITRHFEMLVRAKKPIESPQKDPLASALLVPSVTFKKHIVAMVQKKAEELAARSGGKRRRED